MSELEGVCPKCGRRYFGWALSNPRNQMCDRCGCGLQMKKNGVDVGTGFSPFDAPEYKIDLKPTPKVESAETNKTDPEKLSNS